MDKPLRITGIGPGDFPPPEPTEVSEGFTSLQFLGRSLKVLVCYSLIGLASDDVTEADVEIDGALINGELVEPECFDSEVLCEWAAEIAAEVQSQRESDARDAWELGRDAA